VGLLSWIIAAVVAWIIARLIPLSRRHGWPELLTAVSSAILAGLAAGWLAFGGWAVIEPRAILFVFLVSFASVAFYRLLRRRRG
jgi:hypothetical protein